VADFREFRAERAPGGKNIDGLPDGIAHREKQQQSRREPQRVVHETVSQSVANFDQSFGL
jgi:hypothetical protein